MNNAEDKARQRIKSIQVAVDIESAEGSYDLAWGDLLALQDFDLITEDQKNELDNEASSAKKTRIAELKKKKR